MNTANRFNHGKPQLSRLLDFDNALEELANIMEKGAEKYGDGNWLRGGKPNQEYLDSAMRHILAFQRGELVDLESECHHLAHAAWNMLACIRLNYRDDPIEINPVSDQVFK